MANNQEFYCNHCKKNTLFFLDSDLVWYCDECENPLHSIPWEEEDEFEMRDEFEEEEEDDSEIIRCPSCHNLISLDELELEFLCPVCLEDLSDELYDLEHDDDNEEDEENEAWN